MEPLIFKQVWAMFFLITCFNAFWLKYRSKKYILKNPELKEGYEKYFKGYLFFLNIPWIIIGIGNLSGLTNSTFDYFTPRQMNPMVLFFHASIISLWILSVWWIYFKDGAEFLSKYQYRGTHHEVTPGQIKFFLPIMLLGGIIGMVMMWVIDIPVNSF